MKSKVNFSLTAMFLAAIAFGLTACGGGGGGGGGISYTGVTTQAVIDDTNAETITDAVIDGASGAADASEFPIGGVGASSAGSGDRSPYSIAVIKRLADIAAEYAQSSGNGGSASLAGITQSFTESSPCGGSMTITFTIDDATELLTSMTMKLNNINMGEVLLDGTCGTPGPVLKGSVSATMSYDAFDILTTMTMTFNNVSIAYEGLSEVLNATITVDLVAGTITMTSTHKAFDGKTYKVENLVVVADPGTGALTSINGRVYHPDHGFVDIATTTDFIYAGCPDGEPDSGVMDISGVDVAGDPVTLTVDASGGGDCTEYMWTITTLSGATSGIGSF